MQYRLIDAMSTTGENALSCSCGQRIYPDCDVSAHSINQEFEWHLQDEHGITQAEIDDFLDECRHKIKELV